MRVLLIGGSGSLLNQLIARFKKEGHRVFLLTGKKFHEDRETFDSVFERYDFPYNSDRLAEIFQSADPDLTLFTGAWDTLYDWPGQERQLNARYISDLICLLLAFSTLRKGRFLYLSSEKVFLDTCRERRTEEEEPDNTSYQGMTLIQAEELCGSYRRMQGLDIVILRLAGLYHCPKDLRDIREPVAQMCLEALRDHRISYAEDCRLMPLAQKDAIQFIYQTAVSGNCGREVYQIAGDQAVTEEDLAGRVEKQFSAALEAAVQSRKNTRYQRNKQGKITDEVTHRTVKTDLQCVKTSGQQNALLSNRRYRETFGINRFADLDEDIREICSYMIAHTEVFLEDKEAGEPLWQRFRRQAGWAFRALVPFLESLVLFLVVFFAEQQGAAGDILSSLDLYLLFVLLLSVVHGQQQAVFSALLATFGHVLQEAQVRGSFAVLLDYSTYVWVAQLFIVGLVVGYLRDTIRRQKEEAGEEYRYMEEQVTDMETINNSNVRVKDSLETQVIRQQNSIGRVYEMVSGLDRYSADEVLFYAAQLLEKMMLTEDVAIYVMSGGAYARLFTATSGKARTLGNSIELEKQGYREIYTSLKEHKVYVNRALDPGMPAMACGVYADQDSEERIQAVVMLWELTWEHLTLGDADTLAVICALIQRAVLRARRYLQATESSRFLPGSHILCREAFSELLRAHIQAQHRNLTQIMLLKLRTGPEGMRVTADAAETMIRDTDNMGTLQDGCLYILLSNTDRKGALIVAERLKQHGLQAEIAELPEAERSIGQA